jgi:ornithine--oxo-acid transaminase
MLIDVEDKRYIDCQGGHATVNQGHCHPKILAEGIKQMQNLTLTSRAFFTDQLGEAESFLCKTFGYDKIMFMNSGVEAADSAIKLARRWGYTVKGIASNKAKILLPTQNYWGRNITAAGSSDDPIRRDNFGPYDNYGFELVQYNDVNALEEKLKNDGSFCGFMVEAIQGEAGIIIPDSGYLKKAQELCRKYNVLFIVDEIQTGCGRTGKMMAYEYEGVRPDVLNVGKALSGGFFPVSGVLADDPIMMTIKPGEHGSTYGGNPMVRFFLFFLDVFLW